MYWAHEGDYFRLYPRITMESSDQFVEVTLVGDVPRFTTLGLTHNNGRMGNLGLGPNKHRSPNGQC